MIQFVEELIFLNLQSYWDGTCGSPFQFGRHGTVPSEDKSIFVTQVEKIYEIGRLCSPGELQR